MKKLLIIRKSSEDFGGIEGQVCRLASYLRDNEIAVPALVTSDIGSIFARRFSALGLKVYQAPAGQVDIFEAAEIISGIVQRDDISVVQTHTFRESVLGRVIKFKNPNVVHIFRPQTYINNSFIPNWKKKAYHVLDYVTSGWVDKYVANGEYLAEELKKASYIKAQQIEVVINGRDGIGEPDGPCLIPGGPLPPKVAMVANLFWKKGHDTLIKALGILKKRGIHINARLIGGENTNFDAAKTPITDALKQLAREVGVESQIEFYGHTEDMAAALKDYPVLILPSDSEGVPNCVLEAMSLRKLILASKVGGVPELLTHNVSGLLFPPQNPVATAEVLEEVFVRTAGQWEAMRTAAFHRWQKQFSMAGMMDGYLRVYKQYGIVRN